MRVAVWALIATLGACGKTIDVRSTNEPLGGAPNDEASTGGIASGGSPTSHDGGSGHVPSGGVPSHGATAGVTSSGSAGMPATPDGGATGSAGAPTDEGDETYDACGCGCCGVPVNNSCYYPARGEDLGTIKADNAAAASSPDCANAGCSAGVHHVRCEMPEAEAGAGYKLVAYSAGLDHYTFTRHSAQHRCTSLRLTKPGTETRFLLEIEGGGEIEVGNILDGTCDENGAATTKGTLIGALGVLKKSTTDNCAFEFDFTLFFLAEDGSADPVRFQAEDVALDGMSPNSCP